MILEILTKEKGNKYYKLLSDAGINAFSWSTALKWNFDKNAVIKNINILILLDMY